MRRFPLSLFASAFLIVGLSLPAAAQSTTTTAPTTTTTGPPPIAAEWTRVTDAAGRNIDEVGVTRTADDVLHVFWRQKVPGGNEEQIQHTPVAATGDVGATNVASGPYASVGNPVGILTSDGGLRIFFAGLTGSSSPLDGVL